MHVSPVVSNTMTVKNAVVWVEIYRRFERNADTSSTLKREIECFSEDFVNAYQTASRHILEYIVIIINFYMCM
jgi:hypothetical protein